MAFRLMTDCQRSLFSYQVVTAASWISWGYFPSLGSHRSAVNETIVRDGNLSLWIPVLKSEKAYSPYLKSTSTALRCPCCFSW